MDDEEWMFVDKKAMTAHERFTLMLLERVQALEESIAMLETECTTDELRAVVQVQ